MDNLSEHDNKLTNTLLDALVLEWSDNGNISAAAVRDACIQTLSEALEMSFTDITNLIEKRAQQKQ